MDVRPNITLLPLHLSYVLPSLGLPCLCVQPAIVAAPILAYYNQHPQSFWGPGSIFTCGGSTIAYGPLYNPLRAFVRNLWFYLFTFGFRGDPSWSFNLAGQPLLNPLEAVFFWFGVGTAVYHWRSTTGL